MSEEQIKSKVDDILFDLLYDMHKTVDQAAAEIMKLMQGEKEALQDRVKELEGELERVKPLTESLRADIAKLPIEANYFGAVDRIKLTVVRLERIGWTSRTATENDLEMLTPPGTNNL